MNMPEIALPWIGKFRELERDHSVDVAFKMFSEYCEEEERKFNERWKKYE